MDALQRILVVLGDSEDNRSTIERAEKLAGRHNASLTFVDVNPLSGDYTEVLRDIMPEEEFHRIAFEHRRRQLLEQVGLYSKSKDAVADAKVLEGVPFIEIIRESIRSGHQLICKAAESESVLRKRLFGSTDMHLMRKSPVPVWVLKPGYEGPISRIAAALDMLSTEPEAERFHHRILNLAGMLSDVHEAELHILSAWQLVGESALRNSAFMKVDDAQIEQLLSRTEESVRIRQENLSKWFIAMFPHLPQPEMHCIKGLAKHVIPEFIARQHIDVAVMGTVGRTGVPGLLIGNTAESILADVETSVLTVKPSGFDTPIAHA